LCSLLAPGRFCILYTAPSTTTTWSSCSGWYCEDIRPILWYTWIIKISIDIYKERRLSLYWYFKYHDETYRLCVAVHKFCVSRVGNNISSTFSTWNWYFMNNNFSCGKALSITYCECVFVALSFQYAMRIRRITLYLACPGLSYYSTLSHKRYDFRKKKGTSHKMWVSFSPKFLSEIIPILRKFVRVWPHIYIYILAYTHTKVSMYSTRNTYHTFIKQ
jgi:hypothetical protein